MGLAGGGEGREGWSASWTRWEKGKKEISFLRLRNFEMEFKWIGDEFLWICALQTPNKTHNLKLTQGQGTHLQSILYEYNNLLATLLGLT